MTAAFRTVASSTCYTNIGMERKFYEEFKVKGKDLVDKIKSIVQIPLSIAAVGVLAAPLLAGLGAIAALVANFTLVVERVEDAAKTNQPPPSE